MALDLTMKITADATQAKAELQKVEQGIARVEQAARKGEPSIASVAKELGVYDNVTQKVVQSSAKLEQTTKALSASTTEQIVQQARASLGLDEMHKRVQALDDGYKNLTKSSGAWKDSAIATGVALGGLMAAGALELKFLVDSAKLYAERSGQMDRFSAAVDSVSEHWRLMQATVGGILIGNIHDIDNWAGLAKAAIDAVGSDIIRKMTQAWYIASTVIDNVKKAAAYIPGGTALIDSLSPGPEYAPVTGGGRMANVLLTKDPRSFSTGQMGQASVDPEAAYRDLNRQRDQLDDAARRSAELARRQAEQMKAALQGVSDFQSSYHLTGLYGSLPGVQLGIPQAPGAIPYLPWHAGIQGSIGAEMSRPVAPTAPKTFLQNVFGGDFGIDMSRVITSAITGGGSLLGGAGSLIGSSLTGQLAKTLTSGAGIALKGIAGGAINAILPGLGSLLGPALSGLGKLLGFGETQGHKDLMAANSQIRGLQTSLLSDFGSKENIAALGGGNLIAGWGSQNVEGLKAFSGEVEKFRAQANNAMNDMIHAALTAGQQIPAGMQPILESLIKQGQLTEANANLLMGLPEKGVPSFAQITDAAKELGVNVESLGNKVQGIKLTEQAESAAKAFQTLSDAGADMSSVFEQATPKVQEMVDRALKMGLALPESIKPWLEKMVDAGELVDENGKKLTDLSKFEFTKPLEKSVEDLIKKLDELIQKLGGGVTDAINKIPKNVDVDVHTHVKQDNQDNPDNNPDNYAWGGVVYAARGWRGGWGLPRGTDTVRAWLTPGEIVLNAAQQGNVAGAIRGGGQAVHVHFHEPVIANDYTSLSRFAEFINKATIYGLSANGVKYQ